MNKNADYEKLTQEVYNEILRNLYVNNIDVKHNVRLEGKSGHKHQIDVYWEYQYNNTLFKVAIECKNYNNTVSIGRVRDFWGVLFDLENVKGIMVTKKGYQKGARKFGEYYGIDLMELREPKEGEAVIGEAMINVDCSIRHRLFLVDEDWAKEHDFNVKSYKSRLDMLSFSVGSYKWGGATHIPLFIRDDKIRNSKGEIIFDMEKIEERLPIKIEQNKECVYPFEDAYVKTDYGDIKIKEVKFESEIHKQIKQFEIDAQNITKAILKNTISKKVQLIGKTDLNGKFKMI